MKLATFLHENSEQWGFVWADPVTAELRIVEPGLAEAALAGSGGGTSGYAASRPSFLGTWPGTLAEFLALGDEGMAVLDRLERFLARFASQSDATILDTISHAVADVELLAPIPRPRLCLGLVTNSPSFARANPRIEHLNLFPVAHQRPQGSVVGAGAAVLMRNGHHDPLMSFNVELGVIIGRGGREIPLNEAMRHVAGYTNVTDVAGTYYYGRVPGNAGRGYSLPAEYGDWFFQATASWGGKIADTLCPVGPFLVTKDEVGDPYDLLVYTRQDGRQRDRAHTSATILGVERVIQWYSSFATLHPGDILHLGTMGVDGLAIPREVVERREVVLESEIEQLGVLRNPVQVVPVGERVPFDRHPSYAIRRAAQEPPTDAATWHPDDARHVFTAFGNHIGAPGEGLPRLQVPRFFTGPASSLGADGSRVVLPARATVVEVTIELAAIIGRLASDVDPDDAESYIAGLSPVVSLCDESFGDAVAEPARLGERHIPAVYGRWGDGFNVIGALEPQSGRWRGRRMRLDAGDESVSGSTDDYLDGAAEMLATISAVTTLFPGDVILLGRTAATLRLPVSGGVVAGEIEGLGRVRAEIVRAGAGGATDGEASA
ncbi:fumarylacetoacetate hydrolase family protein [Microbacterium sp. ZW CA_36]|uniref:fumarylacetoacetate hydrolase family protein n=1 Tax=Microbacterium sp. ZW CA_36 TaxID=3378078 RepID=UPI003851D65F